MSFSDYLENEILDHVLGNSAWSAPASVYVALGTGTVGDGTFNEVTGGGYSRVSLTNNLTNWPAASGGSKANGTLIKFSTATGPWGTITAFAIFDASSGGNMLLWGAVSPAQIVFTNDDPEFAIGDLTGTLD